MALIPLLPNYVHSWAKPEIARCKLGDWCNIGDAHVDLQTKRFRAPPGVTLVKLLELASLRLWRPASGIPPYEARMTLLAGGKQGGCASLVQWSRLTDWWKLNYVTSWTATLR